MPSGYIDHRLSGETLYSRDKFEQLLEDGATEVEGTYQKDLICIITNPSFDVAVYCYDEEVFNVIKQKDPVFLRWLTHPKARELANM